MKHFLALLLLLILAAHAQEQEQKRLAILNTVDDGDSPIEPADLNYLTATLREIAGNVLQKHYGIMTDQSIVDKLGKGDAEKACKEARGCLAQLGRKINADYIGQARLGRFSGNLTISVELYNSASGLQASPAITGDAKNVVGLLNILKEKAPAMFKKMPGVSGRIIKDGIDVLTTGKDYELDEEKLYLVSLSTEPTGAVLSFDGVAFAKCRKTPCKLELREGIVRIIANLDQYEIADTTVTINQNYQNINITLKPNFGTLKIKPAYLDNIGKDEQWSLYINGKSASSWENRFSPGKYKVELSHRCYENLSFEAGINKGKLEVFDMANHIKLKKGGLILSAERNAEPVSEPVFVNGKRVGETPFSDAVPLCAEIEIGENREIVYAKLKYNEKVKHTHMSSSYETEETHTTTANIEKPIKTSFWVALGLDVLGTALISYAIYENGKTKEAYKKYNESGHPSDYYGDAWKNTESHRNKRNALYIIGSTALASGIGVHIFTTF